MLELFSPNASFFLFDLFVCLFAYLFACFFFFCFCFFFLFLFFVFCFFFFVLLLFVIMKVSDWFIIHRKEFQQGSSFLNKEQKKLTGGAALTPNFDRLSYAYPEDGICFVERSERMIP